MKERLICTSAFLATMAFLASCGGGGGGDAAATAAGSESASGTVVTVAGGTGSTGTGRGTGNSGGTGTGTGTGTGSGTGSTGVPAGSAGGIDIGVNIHTGGGSTSANGQIASIMASRGLRQARLDYVVNGDTTLLRDQVTRINQNGGKAQLVLQNSYQWDYTCSQSLSTVEQNSYNQALQMVGAMKDIAHDYEILNEIQLRQDVGGQVAWNSQNANTGAYTNSPCAMTLAAVARGISRAVHDQGQRVILGAVGRDWGFLTFMKQQGVTWDVTGYHIYPHYGDASLLSDTWYGAGGPLAQLAAFGKPVTINEFNCGETYDSNFENQAGASVTETCLKSIARHLTDLRNQKVVNLESVIAYELLDEPSKSAPENRFGLMYTLGNPKPALYLMGAFAGGTLTATEQQALTSRGLLTDAQIAAMK
ncbi:hypothetical protein [Ramlibacter humi]|uniref:Arabinogalactan endo-beta-1,4-galactanase n=1 Tax=Ramlibacter humi TaxID=2530451 RepID=A0A4Z0BLA0_9BURK|nr:hypothetical protein [Ramlibacter humi]TFZ00107.1 hypothetical protein EZ216_13440 [Ramlibacter humi]